MKFHSSASISGKVLSVESLHPNVVEAEYAVRGEIATKAEQLRKV